jgi:hypothetical protein
MSSLDTFTSSAEDVRIRDRVGSVAGGLGGWLTSLSNRLEASRSRQACVSVPLGERSNIDDSDWKNWARESLDEEDARLVTDAVDYGREHGGFSGPYV